MILLADSEGPDQTARKRRMIWAFAVRISPKTHGAWLGPYVSLLDCAVCFKHSQFQDSVAKVLVSGQLI